MYREAIAQYNQEHPDTPFQEQTGPVFDLRRANFPANSIGNISIDDVIRSLIVNRIPPAWVDHAYLYGLHSMAHSYTGSAIHEDIYREHDGERLRRLREFGIPRAISAWDGWRFPTRDDYYRILLLTRQEEDHGHAEWLSDGRWLLVGESPFFTHLTDGPYQHRSILGIAPPAPVTEGVVNPSTTSSTSHLPIAVVSTPATLNEPSSTSEAQAMDETPDVIVPLDMSTESVGGNTTTESTTTSTEPVDPPPPST
jgi:hypothetical protein